MPFFPLGNNPLMDIVIGNSLILGDTSTLARPNVPDGVDARFLVIRPPVGVVAAFSPFPLPELDILPSIVSASDGHVITFSLPNNFAPIFYTLDGTNPVNAVTASSKRYTGPVSVKKPPYTSGQLVTVKAKAFALTNSGFADSQLENFQVQIPQKPVLTFTVDNTGDSNVKDILVSADIAGAYSIFYTTNGSTPTNLSTLYTGTFQVTGPASATIKAIAIPTDPIGATGGIIQSDLATVVVSFAP